LPLNDVERDALVGEFDGVGVAELVRGSPDLGHLEPMVTAAERELATARVSEAPEVAPPTPATGTTIRWTSSQAAGSRC
jgi:hypothetical protein